MSTSQAVDYAFEDVFQRGSVKTLPARDLQAEASGQGPLSRREIEVAGLIAQGKTNHEIAELLFIYERKRKVMSSEFGTSSAAGRLSQVCDR